MSFFCLLLMNLIRSGHMSLMWYQKQIGVQYFAQFHHVDVVGIKLPTTGQPLHHYLHVLLMFPVITVPWWPRTFNVPLHAF